MFPPRSTGPDRRCEADRRRFPAWSAPRATLPPLAVPSGAVRRRHVPAGTDVVRARQDVATCLTGWGVPARGTDAVRLVVSELVSHALSSERALRVDVEVVDQHGRVTVVVEFIRSTHREADAPSAPSAIAPCTVGLTVVGRIAERWGHDAAEHGGRFWAVVATPQLADDARERPELCA